MEVPILHLLTNSGKRDEKRGTESKKESDEKEEKELGVESLAESGA